MIALAAAIGIAIVLALTLVRLFIGPTLYDRALVASSVVMKGALACAALAVAAGRSDWIDVAFALALSAFVLNTAVLKFFQAQTFQAPLAHGGEQR